MSASTSASDVAATSKAPASLGHKYLARLHTEELESRRPRAPPAFAVAATHQVELILLHAVILASRAGKLVVRADTTAEGLSAIIDPFLVHMEEEQAAAAKASRAAAKSSAPTKPRVPRAVSAKDADVDPKADAKADAKPRAPRPSTTKVKAVVVADKDDAGSSDEVPADATKKPRGRPKKAVTEEAAGSATKRASSKKAPAASS